MIGDVSRRTTSPEAAITRKAPHVLIHATKGAASTETRFFGGMLHPAGAKRATAALIQFRMSGPQSPLAGCHVCAVDYRSGVAGHGGLAVRLFSGSRWRQWEEPVSPKRGRAGNDAAGSVPVAAFRPGSGECPRCKARVSDVERYCSTCRLDLGATDVRECNSNSERAEVNRRATQCKTRARFDKCSADFDNFSQLLQRNSGVVVAMPAACALSLVSDPRAVYANYETLVAAGLRKPASLPEDKRRATVGGMLFGSYARQIRYGMLSLTDGGLPTYGDVCCRLRRVAIEDRTTFLEWNSYTFVKRYDIREGARVPVGHRAVWDNRHLLALAKLGGGISEGQGRVDWEKAMFETDARDRSRDDFIEAHIYDSFSIDAVETMRLATGKRPDKHTSLIARAALDLFQKSSRGQRGPK